MNWLKETWWIVKQLFTKVKADKVEYKHMDHYPFSGYSAMSWCGYLLSRKPESQIKPTTWNHENIHLYEAKDKKRWISYYWSYVWEWIKGNPIIYPASSAYYTIPYEMEAYANDDNFDYLKTRKSEDLDKYKIKDRKKTYKANKKNWRQYLKTIKQQEELIMACGGKKSKGGKGGKK